jgi:PIN domain nuclease of toxin-antitoxin system
VRILLDSHAVIWWFAVSERLSQAAGQAIGDNGNDVLVSAASAWEITTKHRLGKLPEAEALALNFIGAIASQDFEGLPITVDDAARAGALPGPHRDPFDRLLIAQAQARNLVLISNESLFDRYGVRRLW